MSDTDYDYVREILRSARRGMTTYEFAEYVQRDIMAGYEREVEAARLAYFKGQKNDR